MKLGHWRLVALICGAIWCAACDRQAVRPDDAAAGLPGGYTCCNLHYSQDWISDQSYSKLPMIPAGASIKVTGFGRHRAAVEIDGKPFRLGHDHGRAQETTAQWVAKLVVTTDPKLRLAAYPPVVRQAIQNGQVMVGMSKEQVLMALGYPSTSDTPQLDATVWRYWWAGFSEYLVHWQGERVGKITGHPDTLELMVADGDAASPPAAPPPVPVAARVAVAAPDPAPTAKRRGAKSREKSNANK